MLKQLNEISQHGDILVVITSLTNLLLFASIRSSNQPHTLNTDVIGFLTVTLKLSEQFVVSVQYCMFPDTLPDTGTLILQVSVYLQVLGNRTANVKKLYKVFCGSR